MSIESNFNLTRISWWDYIKFSEEIWKEFFLKNFKIFTFFILQTLRARDDVEPVQTSQNKNGQKRKFWSKMFQMKEICENLVKFDSRPFFRIFEKSVFLKINIGLEFGNFVILKFSRCVLIFSMERSFSKLSRIFESKMNFWTWEGYSTAIIMRWQ